MRWLLERKQAETLTRPLPQLARREVWWPELPGKAVAVLGMRRSGKTCLLWQKVREGLEGACRGRASLPEPWSGSRSA